MSNYQKGKARAIEKAQFWQDYFTKLAKRYGLVKEFRENAII